jgi:hypothetical protein
MLAGEDPAPRVKTEPPPLAISTCFDKLEVVFNLTLLEMMESHLKSRESGSGEDTDFDRWLHGQIYQSDYNTI